MVPEKDDLNCIRMLIQLIAAGAVGREVTIDKVDWDSTIKLAIEHDVLSLVGCALMHSPALPCPEQIKEYILAYTRNVSSSNTLKYQRILHLLKEMEQNGLRTKVLKGYAVAQHYAHPECRCAGDTDLLIDSKQEYQVNAFLSGKGFQLLERSASSHHGIAAHPKYGKIETHVSLHNEIVEDIWFQEVDDADMLNEDVCHVVNADGSYETLGYTDHLVFITLHMIKHFIGTGLTMRMIMDTALFFASNKAKIDSIRFWNILERLDYRRVVDCILSLVIETGYFCQEDFPGICEENKSTTDLLIEDMFCGGYMGRMEAKERHIAAMDYNRQMALKEKNAFQYYMYMLVWKVKNGTAYMFPSRELLVRMHPVVEKYPVLNPVFRIYQLIIYPIQRVFKGTFKKEIRTGNVQTTEVAKRRFEMFRKFGMIQTKTEK